MSSLDLEVLVASFSLLGEALGRALHFGSHSSLLQLDGVFQRTGEMQSTKAVNQLESIQFTLFKVFPIVPSRTFSLQRVVSTF